MPRGTQGGKDEKVNVCVAGTDCVPRSGCALQLVFSGHLLCGWPYTTALERLWPDSCQAGENRWTSGQITTLQGDKYTDHFQMSLILNSPLRRAEEKSPHWADEEAPDRSSELLKVTQPSGAELGLEPSAISTAEVQAG